jgi:hypothetical protein
MSVCGAKNRLGSDHVLLVSQLLTSLEGTWGVIHRNAYYHNFDMYELSALAFVNKPILSVYVVVHPVWRLTQADEPPQVKPPRKSGPQIKLSALRNTAHSYEIPKWT